MPTAQAMVVRLNDFFGPNKIPNLKPSWFDGNLTTSDIDEINAAVSDKVITGATGISLSPDISPERLHRAFQTC